MIGVKIGCVACIDSQFRRMPLRTSEKVFMVLDISRPTGLKPCFMANLPGLKITDMIRVEAFAS